MNSMQISCFLEAAECLSFTSAASRLYVTQSTLSKNIATLEQELGVQLFIRDYKKTQLTPGGAILYAGLRELTGQVGNLVEDAKRANSGLTGTLKIGTLPGQHISASISGAIHGFEARYRDIRIEMMHSSFGELIRQLRSGDLDVAISTTFSIETEPDLRYKEFVRLKNYLVISKNHPLANGSHLSLLDFKDDTFLSVAQEDSGKVTRLMQESCRQAGFEPNILEAPDLDTMILWMEMGRGVSSLNEEHMMCLSPQMLCLPLPEFPPVTLSFAWSKQNTNPSVSLFVGSLPAID